MKKTTQATHTPYRTPLFGNLRMLCASALLAALSIVLGKYLAINITQIFRFSFENLPILMAGIFFGPLIGGAVGVVADLIGCVLVGYAINPIITLGAALIGILSGLITHLCTRPGRTLSPAVVVVAVAVAHVLGSMVVKSVGMAVYYSTPLPTLIWRVPIYLVIGGVESAILVLLLRNRLFMGEINRLLRPRGARK